MGYVIGVDIGTSSTKAVLFDDEGAQIGKCAQGYVLNSPTAGAAEQDADDILRATVKTAAGVVKESGIDPTQLRGIAFSAAMHTLLLVDESGQPITPMFTWADSRGNGWVESVRLHSPNLYSQTSVPIHPMSPVVKLAWLGHEQSAVFDRAARIVSIKEYVLHEWCGQWLIDLSIASTTGLLNLASQDWEPMALKAAGICREQLSEIVPTTHQMTLRAEMADAMNLCSQTVVVIGASDGVLANLGVGAIAPDLAAITLGTSGAVRRVLNQPTVAAEGQLFCYPLVSGRWVMGGAVNNGGFLLQWTRDNLVPYSVAPDEGDMATSEPSKSTYERLTKMASAIAPGADGLIFHPHLLGERSPLWDAQARASFFGLGKHHTQGHLVRAVMEGVLYNLQSVFSALEAVGGDVSILRASGGFAHSDLWQQILADVFEREVQVPAVIESSAFGAAALALVSLGVWDSLEQVNAAIDIAHIRQPIAGNVRRYRKLMPIYTDLLTSVSSQYAALQLAIAD
ncbi:MAG: gluconokinase [Cyanobacteria bacterium J06626_6]